MFKSCLILRHFIVCGLLAATLICDLSAQISASAEDIRGPKALVEILHPQQSPAMLWLGITGVLVLLAVAVLWWKKFTCRQRLKAPSEIALGTLVELEASGEAITAEIFANRAAQAVRQYIAGRFDLAAPQRTTEEFFADLAQQEAASLIAESDHLRVFLKACDLAKFAGSSLDSGQRGELIQAARSFIRITSQSVTP